MRQPSLFQIAAAACWLGIMHSASADLVLDNLGSTKTIDFSEFTGSGFSPSPTSGQLDSRTWRITGMSDGDGMFGGTHASGDFARGTHAGGTGTGGIFAFLVASGDTALGVQPTGADFTPGTMTLRLLNSTGVTVTALQLSYDIYVRNDNDRANSFNFRYSADDNQYTTVSSLDFTSPGSADSSPEWTSTDRSVTLSGLSIAHGSQFYLQWISDDVSGSGARDEFALDNVSVTAVSAVPEPSSAALVGLFGVGLLGARRRKPLARCVR